MTRYRLLLEYDGGPFAGWQRQENARAVQQVLEEALFALSGERVTVHGSGRTDAGVHALGQVAHFDLAADFPAETVRDALNFHIKPDPVVVLAAARAEPGFHARFDARARHYRYRILNRRVAPAIDAGRVWHVPRPLAAAAMAEAAKGLLGKHDFTSFRATHCQAKSPLKTLDRLDVEVAGDEILIGASARSFLHHQVRNLVGTLKWVGEGKWTAADVLAALAARDRAAGGPTAPAAGLYLVAVDYGGAGE